MDKKNNIRWGWLKRMYIYTIVTAGFFGLSIIFVPKVLSTMFNMAGMPVPDQDPFFLGITGSVYLSFAFLSILGLRSPLKFTPVLLLQLSYKTIWLIGVILPIFLAGKHPAYAVSLAVLFATYIIGDLIAIPFPYVFAKRSE